MNEYRRLSRLREAVVKLTLGQVDLESRQTTNVWGKPMIPRDGCGHPLDYREFILNDM